MKALTLWQPWATLIAAGIKTVETRSWETGYRGPLAIHAAKRLVAPDDLSFIDRLVRARYGDEVANAVWDHAVMSNGVIVATCHLASVVPTRTALRQHPDQEPWGDFTPGRWAWVLADVQRLDEPVPASGRQQLWEWAA